MTLTEATQGKKLRALPPRLGVGNAPWKGRAWNLADAVRDYLRSRSTFVRAWSRPTKSETFANAHARRHKQLREAVLLYTADPAFVDRAFRSEAWQFADANDLALEGAA